MNLRSQSDYILKWLLIVLTSSKFMVTSNFLASKAPLVVISLHLIKHNIYLDLTFVNFEAQMRACGTLSQL